MSRHHFGILNSALQVGFARLMDLEPATAVSDQLKAKSAPAASTASKVIVLQPARDTDVAQAAGAPQR